MDPAKNPRPAAPTLYYYPGNASLAPHIVLRELSIPHDLAFVDRGRRQHKTRAYRALNPHGRIPTLVHGGLTVTESAAICLYLADLRPGQLAPRWDEPLRPFVYQWMFFLSNTLQPVMMDYHYPEQRIDHPKDADPAHLTPLVKDKAREVASELFSRVDATLCGRSFLVTRTPSICDYYLLMLARWARDFEPAPSRLSNLGPMLERLLERESVQGAFAREGLEAPFV